MGGGGEFLSNLATISVSAENSLQWSELGAGEEHW
jgi:hypothetical protein